MFSNEMYYINLRLAYLFYLLTKSFEP